MAPKFRLEDTMALSDGSNPITQSVVKIDYTNQSYARCDSGGGPCYGCNSAELKPTQEDIKVYSKVA